MTRALVFDVDGVLVHGYHARPERQRRWDENLLADLSSGVDHAQSLDACRRAALAVDSRLGSFYAACVARAGDFSLAAPTRLVG